MASTRTQLTLFADPDEAAAIERLRAEHDPVQHGLIACHVTLCREDELVELERVTENLRTGGGGLARIALDFGPARRFSEGKGVLSPAIGDTRAFHDLRAAVLRGAVTELRTLEPHITLMHPRNSTCTDAAFAAIARAALPARLSFAAISVIEQIDGGRWETLAAFAL
jgi:hypothetical protein